MKLMKKVFIILLILLSFSFTSCVKHTPDTNGPHDLSLSTITIEDILNGNGETMKTGAVKVQKGRKCSIKVKKFSGIETLAAFSLNNSAFHFSINAEVYEGNFKLLLCTKDKVLREILVNEGTQSFKLPPTTATIFLKAAGESAFYNLTYEYKIDMPVSMVI